MYEQRFQLKRRPFPATLDDSLYYPSTGHESALQSLLRGIQDDEGLLLLTAQPGLGKTLIAHCLTERLDSDITTAFLTNSHIPDTAALLQSILFDLQLPYEGVTEQILRLRLTEHLLKNCASGKRFVLIVDDAHLLNAELFEELRLLGNLEAAGKKAFQVVLLAQPSIHDKLKTPALASVQQRIAVRCVVERLGLEESLDYLLHHLRLAGGKPERIFDEAALETLARGAQGVPRLLNQAGHQALSLAHAAELGRVDAEAAMEALAVLGLAENVDADNGHTAEKEDPAAFEVGGPRQVDKGAAFRLAEDTRKIA